LVYVVGGREEGKLKKGRSDPNKLGCGWTFSPRRLRPELLDLHCATLAFSFPCNFLSAAASPQLPPPLANRAYPMSALLETSLGDIVIDLLVDESPKACEK
jgi:hypothetical protein